MLLYSIGVKSQTTFAGSQKSPICAFSHFDEFILSSKLNILCQYQNTFRLNGVKAVIIELKIEIPRYEITQCLHFVPVFPTVYLYNTQAENPNFFGSRRNIHLRSIFAGPNDFQTVHFPIVMPVSSPILP